MFCHWSLFICSINNHVLGVISYGQSISDFKSNDPEVLSYSANSEVAVFSKDIYYHGVEMWEAQVSFKRFNR